MNINRTSFIMYHSFNSPFELLDMEQRGILITAIFEYQMYGEVKISLTPLVNMAFVCIKDTLDRDARAYAETCKRNSENGKRGGRPKRNQAVENQVTQSEEKTDRFFSKPKKADNDTDNETENYFDTDACNETESDTECDTEYETESENKGGFCISDDISDDVSDEALRANVPFLDDRQELILFWEGIPDEYVDKRKERAWMYARKNGLKTEEVIIDWWKRDTAKSKPKNNKRYFANKGYG